MDSRKSLNLSIIRSSTRKSKFFLLTATTATLSLFFMLLLTVGASVSENSKDNELQHPKDKDSVESSEKSSKIKVICPTVDYLVLIEDPESCDYYYTCVWGQAVHRPCPDDLWFNPKSSQCDYPARVKCKYNNTQHT